MGTMITSSEASELVSMLESLTEERMTVRDVIDFREYVNRSIYHHITDGEGSFFGLGTIDDFIFSLVKSAKKHKFNSSAGDTQDERDYIRESLIDKLAELDTEDPEFRDPICKLIYEICDEANYTMDKIKKLSGVCGLCRGDFDMTTLVRTEDTYVLFFEDIEDE